MAPTEYRVIAKRATLAPLPSLRGLVAAGEALNPEVLRAFKEATGLEIRDGYGQTETGQLTGMPAGGAVRPGLDGPAAARASTLEVDRRRAGARRPAHRPDVLRRLPRAASRAPEHEPWRTGDRVRADEDGYLYFEGRTDDVIISAGYRIGPFEVESALVSHAAVAEAAVVAAPDDERGSVVRAVVVLRDGFAPSDDARVRAPGPRQARDRALQVPADRRLRRRAAQDRQRQGAARRSRAEPAEYAAVATLTDERRPPRDRQSCTRARPQRQLRRLEPAVRRCCRPPTSPRSSAPAALALMIPPDRRAGRRPGRAARPVDGLILAGGDDIDPAAYGAEPHPRDHATPSPSATAFELALTRRAVERDMPVLGICRGMQVLNVAFGGTLLQHLPDDVRPRASTAASPAASTTPTTTSG